MSSVNKILRGVAHDIAHHSQSGLSWIHPHLFLACRDVGALSTEFELLEDSPYPSGLPERKPLQLALQGLREKFLNILELKRVPCAAVKSVRLKFEFPLSNDGTLSLVIVVITSSDGTQFKGIGP